MKKPKFSVNLPTTKTAGAYRIATELRQAGFTCQVADITSVDSKIETLFFAKIVEKFVGPNTLWVGFSTNFVSDIAGYPHFEDDEHYRIYNSVHGPKDQMLLKFMQHCRRLSPNIQFLVGGIRIYDMSRYGFFHFRGHVDQQIVDFTQTLAEGRIPEERIIENKEYSEFCQSRTVFIDQDMLVPEHTLPIEISRGCIFKCKFCSFPLNGKTKGSWIKDPVVLLEEMQYNYEKYNIMHYIIVDDTFNDSVSKLEMLQDKVFSRLPFKPTFSSYLRLDLMMRFPHTVELLKEIGIKSAVFGIETLNPRVAKMIGKGTDPAKQIQFLHDIKLSTWQDINIYSGFIMGFEGQTKKELLDFSDWLLGNDNPLNSWNTNSLGLYPVNPDTKINRLYASEFDITVDRSDYEFYRDGDGKKQWRMKSSGMTSEWVNSLVHEIDSVRHNRPLDRVSQFTYSRYINLGISHDKLTSLTTREIDEQEDVANKIEKMNRSYFKALLK